MKKIITIFAPGIMPQKSGAGANAFCLARSFSALGYKVNLVSFRWCDSPFVEVVDNINIVRIPIFYGNFFFKLFSYLIILPVIAFFLFRSNLSLVFGPMQGYIFLILLGNVTGKKVVYRSTMLDVDDIKSLIHKHGPYLSPLFRKLFGLMGGYIAQSPAMTSRLSKELPGFVNFIETAQGVDVEKFHPTDSLTKNNYRIILGLSSNVKILVSVGYVIERKGLREVFDVLSEQQKDLEFLYVIVGEYKPSKGSYMHSQKTEMFSLYQYGKEKLGEKIIFTGGVNNVVDYLKAADIFILNSKKEGMPNVLLEAMACGLPVIAKPLLGVAGYILHDGDNAVFANDSEELSESVKLLFDKPSLALMLGVNAAELISKKFSIKAVASEIERAFIKE